MFPNVPTMIFWLYVTNYYELENSNLLVYATEKLNFSGIKLLSNFSLTFAHSIPSISYYLTFYILFISYLFLSYSSTVFYSILFVHLSVSFFVDPPLSY